MTDLEDEDSWLYGNTTDTKVENGEADALPKVGKIDKPEVNTEEKQTEDDSGTLPEDKPATGNDLVENKPEENKPEAKNDDDDEDSDDDVQVTIGEITTGGTPSSFPGQGLRTFYRNPVPVAPKPTITKGLNLEAPGDINGVPVMETNIDLLEEKPWRKPGADISDYFNYGFNEETWKQYCEKQKRLRTTSTDQNTFASLAIPKSIQNGISLFSTPPYVPIAKFENTVRTISTLQFSRRKEDELLAANAQSVSTNATPSTTQAAPVALAHSTASQAFLPTIRQPATGTLPNTPLPFPPMNPNQPPPGMPIGVPPPGFLMSSIPPPGMPPPPGVVPPEYLHAASVSYPPGFQPPIHHAAPPSYYGPQDGRDGTEGHYNHYPEDHHRRPSDGETERHSEEDGRYRRERGSSSRRDYDRDRYNRRDFREVRPRERDRERDRDRDKDRDREKEREREKDRERERDRVHDRESSSSRRYREESPSRHKSSRRKHEEDDRHSSKHKKAKKHKHKEKDSDAPPGTDETAASDDHK